MQGAEEAPAQSKNLEGKNDTRPSLLSILMPLYLHILILAVAIPLLFSQLSIVSDQWFSSDAAVFGRTKVSLLSDTELAAVRSKDKVAAIVEVGTNGVIEGTSRLWLGQLGLAGKFPETWFGGDEEKKRRAKWLGYVPEEPVIRDDTLSVFPAIIYDERKLIENVAEAQPKSVPGRTELNSKGRLVTQLVDSLVQPAIAMEPPSEPNFSVQTATPKVPPRSKVQPDVVNEKQDTKFQEVQSQVPGDSKQAPAVDSKKTAKPASGNQRTEKTKPVQPEPPSSSNTTESAIISATMMALSRADVSRADVVLLPVFGIEAVAHTPMETNRALEAMAKGFHQISPQLQFVRNVYLMIPENLLGQVLPKGLIPIKKSASVDIGKLRESEGQLNADWSRVLAFYRTPTPGNPILDAESKRQSVSWHWCI